jgi:transcriptional regulator with XRE-family HTH domain
MSEGRTRHPVPAVVAHRTVQSALFAARRLKGMTQQQAADALEWPLMRVREAEQGVQPLTEEMLRELARLYEITARRELELATFVELSRAMLSSAGSRLLQAIDSSVF